jgi:hypothetical protein
MFGGKSMLEWLKSRVQWLEGKSVLELIGLLVVLVIAFYVFGALFLFALSLWPLWLILFIIYVYRKNRA